jgi:hypothetical protein
LLYHYIKINPEIIVINVINGNIQIQASNTKGFTATDYIYTFFLFQILNFNHQSAGTVYQCLLLTRILFRNTLIAIQKSPNLNSIVLNVGFYWETEGHTGKILFLCVMHFYKGKGNDFYWTQIN